MLKITGSEEEINLVGEIFNTVLGMLGGDVESDGFGYSLPSQVEQKTSDVKIPRIFKLETSNNYEVKEQLELIIEAIHKSYKNKGLFSKKEKWLEYYKSR